MFLFQAEPIAVDGELYRPSEGNPLLSRRKAEDEESGGSTERTVKKAGQYGS